APRSRPCCTPTCAKPGFQIRDPYPNTHLVFPLPLSSVSSIVRSAWSADDPMESDQALYLSIIASEASENRFALFGPMLKTPPPMDGLPATMPDAAWMANEHGRRKPASDRTA